MTAHGVITTGSQEFLHPTAGVAQSCYLQFNATDSDNLVFQCQQVNAADDQIPTEGLGTDIFLTNAARNHGLNSAAVLPVVAAAVPEARRPNDAPIASGQPIDA